MCSKGKVRFTNDISTMLANVYGRYSKIQFSTTFSELGSVHCAQKVSAYVWIINQILRSRKHLQNIIKINFQPPSLSVALFIVLKRQVSVDRLPVYFGSLHNSQALQTLSIYKKNLINGNFGGIRLG